MGRHVLPLRAVLPLRGLHEGPSSQNQGYFLGYGTFFLCGDRPAYDRDLATLLAQRVREAEDEAAAAAAGPD